MKAYCLGSGSSGNCYLFQFNNGEKIMVECGLTFKEMLIRGTRFLVNPCEFKNVFITHAHGDHCCCVNDLVKRSFNVYASEETAQRLNIPSLLKTSARNKINDNLSVIPFSVQHDIEGSVGFAFFAGDEKVLFINDFKRFEVDLSKIKFNYVFIECNYYQKMVYTIYSESVKRFNNGDHSREIINDIKMYERNLKSHASLATTVKALNGLNLSECKAIFLMHLSEHNSAPLIMRETITKTFKKSVYICQKNGGIQ